MTQIQKNKLLIELPPNWCAEDDGDILHIFNPTGNGTMTMSFYEMIHSTETADEQVSILAKKFIDRNWITLHNPLILYGTPETRITLYGTGVTVDDWFVKVWVVAKPPQMVLISYQSKKKHREIKVCDTIIAGIQFLP